LVNEIASYAIFNHFFGIKIILIVLTMIKDVNL